MPTDYSQIAICIIPEVSKPTVDVIVANFFSKHLTMIFLFVAYENFFRQLYALHIFMGGFLMFIEEPEMMITSFLFEGFIQHTTLRAPLLTVLKVSLMP